MSPSPLAMSSTSLVKLSKANHAEQPWSARLLSVDTLVTSIWGARDTPSAAFTRRTGAPWKRAGLRSPVTGPERRTLEVGWLRRSCDLSSPDTALLETLESSVGARRLYELSASI